MPGLVGEEADVRNQVLDDTVPHLPKDRPRYLMGVGLPSDIIEGVWRGRTRTYDLRGKKFCVVMAGNPYTESGEKFTIPDMLANRADTYNLGDILGGKEEQFALRL